MMVLPENPLLIIVARSLAVRRSNRQASPATTIARNAASRRPGLQRRELVRSFHLRRAGNEVRGDE
jgi:hypothetical protein